MRHRDAIVRLRSLRRGARFSESAFVVEDMRQFPRSLSVQLHGLRAIAALTMSTVSVRDECKREKCDCPTLFSSAGGKAVALPEVVSVAAGGGAAADGGGVLSDPFGTLACARAPLERAMVSGF